MADQDEGMSTKKKVAAGAAVGLAVPAAVGVAKKFLGSDDESQEREGGADRTSGSERRSMSSRGGSRSATSRAASSGSRSGSSSSSARQSRATSTRSRSGTSRAATRSKSTSGRSSSARGSSGRTKEQLYQQAQRLKIDGRSKMSKAQLERAVARARS